VRPPCLLEYGADCSRAELESTVNSLQEENRNLLAQLQNLRSSSAFPATPSSGPILVDPTLSSPAPPQTPSGLGIDHSYLQRILKELTSNKSILLDRSLSILEEQGKDVPKLAALRTELLDHAGTLSGLKAEWGGLGGVLEALKVEREGLGKQEDIVTKLIEKRRDGRVGHEDGNVAEVEEMGRLVDAASNGWTVRH
jgi:hypothetical protein